MSHAINGEVKPGEHVSTSISTIKRSYKETEWVCVLSEGNSAVIHQPWVKTIYSNRVG